MERSPSSKRATALGGDDEHSTICNGIGVDGKWEHQRVYQGPWGCEPVSACKVLLRVPTTSITDNRFFS